MSQVGPIVLMIHLLENWWHLSLLWGTGGKQTLGKLKKKSWYMHKITVNIFERMQSISFNIWFQKAFKNRKLRFLNSKILGGFLVLSMLIELAHWVMFKILLLFLTFKKLYWHWDKELYFYLQNLLKMANWYLHSLRKIDY